MHTFLGEGMPLFFAIVFGRGHCPDVGVAVVCVAATAGHIQYLGAGIVVVAADVGALHEYTGIGMQSRAKTCDLRLKNFFVCSGRSEIRRICGALRIGLRGYGATSNTQNATRKPLCQTLTFY